MDPLSSHRGGDRAARPPPIPAAIMEEMMNSEVGTGSADFTYIKNAVRSEVGTRDADFETVKVGIRSANFKWVGAACFQVEVGTRDADFQTVKVGIRSADFLFFCTSSFGSQQVDCRLLHSGSR